MFCSSCLNNCHCVVILTEYDGLGLDYTYELAFSEAVGNIDCMGVPTAIGVQTDYATPALAR